MEPKNKPNLHHLTVGASWTALVYYASPYLSSAYGMQTWESKRPIFYRASFDCSAISVQKVGKRLNGRYPQHTDEVVHEKRPFPRNVTVVWLTETPE